MKAGPLLGGAVATFAARLFSGGIRYATGIAIARLFGGEVFGAFGVGSVVLLFAATVAAGGATSGLMALAAERIETGGREAAGEVIRACRRRTWGLSLLLSALLAALGTFAPGALGAAGDPATVAGVAVSLPFLAVANVLENGTRGLRTTRYEVLLRCVLQPLLFVALLLAGRDALAPAPLVWGAFAGSLAVEMLAAEILVARLFPRGAAPGGRSPAPAMSTNLFHDAVAVVTGGLDLWLAGLLGSAAAAGHYAAATRSVEVIAVLLSSFQMLLAPTIASLIAAGREEEIAPLSRSVGRAMFLLAGAVALPIAAAGGPILALFGGSFAEARLPLVLLALVPAVGALAAPASGILIVRAPGRLGAIKLGAGAITAILGLALWPRFGLVGLAVASGVGALAVHGAVLRALPEGFRSLVDPMAVREAILLLLVGSLAGLGISRLTGAAGGWSPLLEIPVIGAVTVGAFAVAWWLLPWGAADRRALADLAARVRGRLDG